MYAYLHSCLVDVVDVADVADVVDVVDVVGVVVVGSCSTGLPHRACNCSCPRGRVTTAVRILAM